MPKLFWGSANNIQQKLSISNQKKRYSEGTKLFLIEKVKVVVVTGMTQLGKILLSQKMQKKSF